MEDNQKIERALIAVKGSKATIPAKQLPDILSLGKQTQLANSSDTNTKIPPPVPQFCRETKAKNEFSGKVISKRNKKAFSDEASYI
jgi:hypothetical protein